MKYTVTTKFHGPDGRKYIKGDVVDDDVDSFFLDLYLDSDSDAYLQPFDEPSEALTSAQKKNQRTKVDALKEVFTEKNEQRKVARGGKPRVVKDEAETF